MSYHGRVHPGGVPQVRLTEHWALTKVSVGPMDNNAYLLRCLASGETLLVDAAAEAPTLLALIGDGTLVGVLTTHRHQDHVGALAEVVAATGARPYAHRLDASHLPVPTDVEVEHGTLLRWGRCEGRVVHLAGHTPGGLALVVDDPAGHPHAFTGDSLFPGGVGRTESPDAFEQLWTAVRDRLFADLPDETWVYPGHGDDTTLGTERPRLDQWRARGW
jgi:glyoxylase-like metal-dependent hydrolase (beta-lactamase superfamily II)